MCGIVGVVARSAVNQILYDGLLVLQHRGQDAAGIVTADGASFHMHKGGGMVRADSVDKNIPAFIEVYEMKYGKGARPKGLEWDAYRVIAGSRQFLRIIVLPPGAPKKAVDDLRAAWTQTTKDKDYLAEYRKQNNSELEALVGEDAAAAIADVLNVKPEVRKFIVDFAAKK